MDTGDRTTHELPRLSDTETLVEAGAATADAATGEMRAKLANAMVGLKKEHFGRGPTAAKAWLLDDYVFVALCLAVVATVALVPIVLLAWLLLRFRWI